MPGRAKTTNEIDKWSGIGRARSKEFLSHAQTVSLCVDIWTKRRMTSSYLGISGHFFCRFDCKEHIVVLVLAVTTVPVKHAVAQHAVRVKKESSMHCCFLPSETNLQQHCPNKDKGSITGNGSNQVKSLRQTAISNY